MILIAGMVSLILFGGLAREEDTLGYDLIRTPILGTNILLHQD